MGRRSCSSTPRGCVASASSGRESKYYSELRALEAAGRADVALVLVDASEGSGRAGTSPVADVARQGRLLDARRHVEMGCTQIDLQEAKGLLHRRLRQRSPVIAVSVKTGRGLVGCWTHVESALREAQREISTPELNRALVSCARPARGRTDRGRRLKLITARRPAPRPPRFRIFVNSPRLITRDYGYWVENELRARFGFRRCAGSRSTSSSRSNQRGKALVL